MASITIRNMENDLKARLRVRAAHHGRSMEEEARDILRSVLAGESSPPADWAERIQRRFAEIGGVDFPEPQRDALREPPDFTR